MHHEVDRNAQNLGRFQQIKQSCEASYVQLPINLQGTYRRRHVVTVSHCGHGYKYEPDGIRQPEIIDLFHLGAPKLPDLGRPLRALLMR